LRRSGASVEAHSPVKEKPVYSKRLISCLGVSKSMWSATRSLSVVVATLLATSCVAVREMKESEQIVVDSTSTLEAEVVQSVTRSLLQAAGILEKPLESKQFQYTVADACIADVSVFDESAKPHIVHADYTASVRCCSIDGSQCSSKKPGPDGDCLPSSVTFTHAKGTCENFGMRLPSSVAELGSACGTGCLFDYKEIWYDESQEGVQEYRSSKQLAHVAKRVLLYGDTLRVGSYMAEMRNVMHLAADKKAFTPNKSPFYLETFAHKLQRQLNAWGLTACGAKVDFGGQPGYKVSQLLDEQTSQSARCIYKPQVHAEHMETVCPGLLALIRKAHTAGTPYGFVLIMAGQADVQEAHERVSISNILRDLSSLHSQVWAHGAKTFYVTLPRFPVSEIDHDPVKAKLMEEYRLKLNHGISQLAADSDGKGILVDLDKMVSDLSEVGELFTMGELNLNGYLVVAEKVADALATSGENINPCGSPKHASK